jgi:hypothetical protein
MFPKAQLESDKKRGLTSFRPSRWDQIAESMYASDPKETWGQVYARSMRAELENIGGSLVLLDTAIKPNYKKGKQHYGSVDGTDPSKDPLLPLFKEVHEDIVKGKLSPAARQEKKHSDNRFNWSSDNLQLVLDRVKEKITKELNSRGLANVDFEVILVPATLDNLEMTFNSPESSSTGTWERTSTVLLDKDNKSTDQHLLVGHVDNGGAGDVNCLHRSVADDGRAARLTIVFKKRPTA